MGYTDNKIKRAQKFNDSNEGNIIKEEAGK